MLAIKETETPDFAAAAIIVAFSDTIILAVLTVVRVSTGIAWSGSYHNS
jgi:hypothetical protein